MHRAFSNGVGRSAATHHPCPLQICEVFASPLPYGQHSPLAHTKSAEVLQQAAAGNVPHIGIGIAFGKASQQTPLGPPVQLFGVQHAAYGVPAPHIGQSSSKQHIPPVKGPSPVQFAAGQQSALPITPQNIFGEEGSLSQHTPDGPATVQV